MSWYNKVLWNEGLFLLPQHFQQQERYLEHHAHRRSLPLSPFFWGFSRYVIDDESLLLGKLVLREVSGIFNDGTPFDIPYTSPPPLPLNIRPQHLEQDIYLAVPVRIPNGLEVQAEEQLGSLARYEIFEQELRDSAANESAEKTLQLVRLRLRLLPADEMNDGWMGMPIARIRNVQPDGKVELHSAQHIPPINAVGASALLKDWLGNVHGLVRLRAQALAQRLAGEGAAGTQQAAEVADYLLLQILNRFEPLLEHMLSVDYTPPVDLYTSLRCMIAELATYARPAQRRAKDHSAYQHEAPYACFKPLIDDLQLLLNEVLVRSAQNIPIQARGHGMYLAVMAPGQASEFGSLVLAVNAQMPMETLQTRFVAQSKLAPSDLLNDIVRSHLPGLLLQAMPVPPRQIPFNANHIYFEIARRGNLWEQVERDGGLALQVAGDFPGLSLQLWGIREQ